MLTLIQYGRCFHRPPYLALVFLYQLARWRCVLALCAGLFPEPEDRRGHQRFQGTD